MDELARQSALYEAQLEEKLKDPVRRRAWELAEEGRELLFMKQFDEAIEKITEAATLDPEYASRIKGAQEWKNRELRKSPVRLTYAVNRILYPRLKKLGFRQRCEEDGPKWKEGTMQVRTNSYGQETVIYMGRAKFGKSFPLSIWKNISDNEHKEFDLSTVGLDDESLCYLNQAEANEMLERIAEAFEGPILVWMEKDE